jgi:3-dehydroquinate synthase
VKPATFRLGGCTIHAGVGLLDRVGAIARDAVQAHRWAIVSDTHVAPLYAARAAAGFADVRTDLFTLPAGETHKTRDEWARITDSMLAAGLGRDAAVLALGGGVVGDVAGFVAATFMRGIPIVQVPTTLLAMIDASIGGKTGVDTPAGKNLVGAFHDPAAVVADAALLATLPERERRAGAAEAIKHGAIADATYFNRVTESLPAALGAPAGEEMHHILTGSIAIKTAIVTGDAREGGRRKVLNFGHTLGHAIEAASEYALLHGEAIAIGMVLEAELAEHLRVAAKGTAHAIRAAVESVALPSRLPKGMDPGRVLELTRSDKKSRAGVVAYALPTRIGTMAAQDTGWTIAARDADVRAILSPS